MGAIRPLVVFNSEAQADAYWTLLDTIDRKKRKDMAGHYGVSMPHFAQCDGGSTVLQACLPSVCR